MSLPARERELKFFYLSHFSFLYSVAPRTGAWIEILIVPKAGIIFLVAPRTGAWIEIIEDYKADMTNASRSPHGSVNWN